MSKVRAEFRSSVARSWDDYTERFAIAIHFGANPPPLDYYVRKRDFVALAQVVDAAETENTYRATPRKHNESEILPVTNYDLKGIKKSLIDEFGKEAKVDVTFFEADDTFYVSIDCSPENS